MNEGNSIDCRAGTRRLKAWLLIGLLFMLAGFERASGQAFVRRTQDVGLASGSGTNGVAVADYDRDGDLDVYFVTKGSFKANDPATWNRLFANRGNGTFVDVTAQAGVAGNDANPKQNPTGMGQKMGASWSDFDNDGWPDLFLTHFGPNQLLRNNGDGTFSDVTPQAGVAGGEVHLSSSALWFDYDRDGDLDLYVSVYGDYSGTTQDRRNRLYENLGDGTFADVSEASGAAYRGATWTTVALDADHDGHLDLYLANDFGRNIFYLNNGDKTFSERTSEFGLEDPYHGMGLAITDCDGNGFFDIYLTNITESGFEQEINPLFLNTGQNSFINYSVQAGLALAGWGWGTKFFDLENDGDPDLFVVTGNFLPEYPNELFLNVSSTDSVRFENIAVEAGVADSAAARSLAIFDYDYDGDVDLLISNFSEPPVLYENTSAHGNWLTIALEGTASNRNGFGAVVEVEVAGKTYYKYHHGAQFLAQSIQPLHFGLDTATEVERITVRWPGGHVEEIGPVAANQKIHIREHEGLVTAVRQPEVATTQPPESVRLLGNYPNPFNGATNIRFELAAPGEVELRITNVRGQIVHVQRTSYTTAGEKSIRWQTDATNLSSTSSGLYFYSLHVVGNLSDIAVGKMIYVK